MDSDDEIVNKLLDETKLCGSLQDTMDVRDKKIHVLKDITIQNISIHGHQEENGQVVMKPQKKKKSREECPLSLKNVISKNLMKKDKKGCRDEVCPVSSDQTINCQGLVNVENKACLLETKLCGTPENTRDMPDKKIDVRNGISIQKISIHGRNEVKQQVVIKPKKMPKTRNQYHFSEKNMISKNRKITNKGCRDRDEVCPVSSPQTFNCLGLVNVENKECLLETKLCGTPENTMHMRDKKIYVLKDFSCQKDISVHSHYEENDQVVIKPKKKKKSRNQYGNSENKIILKNRVNKFNDCKDANSLNDHLNIVKEEIILKSDNNPPICPEMRNEKSENELPDCLGETIVNTEQYSVTEHEKEKNNCLDYKHGSDFNEDHENYENAATRNEEPALIEEFVPKTDMTQVLIKTYNLKFLNQHTIYSFCLINKILNYKTNY